MPLDPEQVRRRFENLNVWSRGDERAPHKPLLLLLALGRASRGEDRLVEFAAIEDRLRMLLVEFGPPRTSHHPEYPFWRLQNDDVWEVVGAEGAEPRRGQTDPRVTELRRVGASGGFPVEIDTALRSDPDLLRDVAHQLLDESFPESLHEDIAAAVGLALGGRTIIQRDPTFRDRVLVAYGYSCAVCGYDLRLKHAPVALEAAHIKWHQARGPAAENNGLALCTMHHKLFDRGAMTVSDDRRVLVSPLVNGSQGLEEWLRRFHRQPLRTPRDPRHIPLEEYVRWHVQEVFKGAPGAVA